MILCGPGGAAVLPLVAQASGARFARVDLVSDIEQHRRHFAEPRGIAVAADDAAAVGCDRQDEVIELADP